MGALSRWRKIDPDRLAMMKATLERILSTNRLSRHTCEIASKSLE